MCDMGSAYHDYEQCTFFRVGREDTEPQAFVFFFGLALLMGLIVYATLKPFAVSFNAPVNQQDRFGCCEVLIRTFFMFAINLLLWPAANLGTHSPSPSCDASGGASFYVVSGLFSTSLLPITLILLVGLISLYVHCAVAGQEFSSSLLDDMDEHASESCGGCAPIAQPLAITCFGLTWLSEGGTCAATAPMVRPT